jgi:hypothetical protein
MYISAWRPSDFHDHTARKDLEPLNFPSNNGRSVKLSYPQNTEFNTLKPEVRQGDKNLGDMRSLLQYFQTSGDI